MALVGAANSAGVGLGSVRLQPAHLSGAVRLFAQPEESVGK